MSCYSITLLLIIFCNGVSVITMLQGTFGYVEYFPGDPNSRLIIAAPHGGYLKPRSMPDRVAGCWDGSRCVWRHSCGFPDVSRCQANTARDTNTRDLAIRVWENMEQLTGIKPHLIISNLHRVKMDPNRSVNEAAFGVPNAMQAYREYHSFIREAYGRVRGAGLFIDIHGQSHPNRWIELGYLVSTRRLNENNAIPQFSSIRSLYNSLRDYVTFDHLLRGDYSLGRLLNRRGYRAVPSPGIRAPGRAAYFTGGYSTMTYGSRFSGKIDSIQVESPVHLRTDRRRPTYARDLAKVLRDFMALYN